MTLVIDLVPHLDAGDRKKWQGDQDQRPLTELGRRQATALAAALAAEPVDALYSSPSLRCRQTLEPLAERFGLKISVLPGLGEAAAWKAPEQWTRGPTEALVGAFAAGSALAALEQARAEHREGRLVACSHGHIIPTLASFLIAAHGLEGVPELTHRGQWHRIRFNGDAVSLELREAQGEFPQ